MAPSTEPGPDAPAPITAALVAELSARGMTVAVAESLTGGLVTAELVRPAGASAVVNGSVVAYATQLKHTLLGVDAELLEREGPVHPEVAEQMARNVRAILAVDGSPASVGIATTGVAGPDPQAGHPVGTVYLGLSIGDDTVSKRLELAGTRDEIRARAVSEAVAWLSGTIRSVAARE
ncbi:CinA family protein [Cryobacterium sp. BB736]|uniref:CinA family protein n=1 Tax=Cryobacterium sp. BB736 TaxID=2746963 RepID=UPI001875161C|nr:nicotinamide-nucleotide amidohydrolase family protein [Cryobacterium sp. BB736]